MPAPQKHERLDTSTQRERIADAMARLLSQRAFADITVEDLRGELELSKGGLYHHIRSKDEALILVCQRAGEAMLDALDVALNVGSSAKEQLEELIVQHHQLVKVYGGALWAFFSERDRLPQHDRDEVLNLERKYLRGLESIITHGQKSGELTERVQPRTAALSIIGVLNWVARWSSTHLRSSAPIEELTHVLLMGMCND